MCVEGGLCPQHITNVLYSLHKYHLVHKDLTLTNDMYAFGVFGGKIRIVLQDLYLDVMLSTHLFFSQILN